MATSSLPLPELQSLCPQISPRRHLVLSNFCSCKSLPRYSSYNIGLRTRICAIKEEDVAIEERKSELVERVNAIGWSGNGVASTSGSDYGNNGSAKGYVNGNAGVIESENKVTNGSLVKYVNGNGVAAEVVEGVEASNVREEGRKKRIEEIGKEEAWFKQSGRELVEVRAFDVD